MSKAVTYSSPYEFEGRIPLKQAVPLGLQHVLAMFVGNLTPVMIISGACGIAAGAKPVMDAMVMEIEKLGINNVELCQTGCIGVCRLEPIVEIISPKGEKTTYVKMTEEKAVKVVHEHIVNNKVVEEYTIANADK